MAFISDVVENAKAKPLIPPMSPRKKAFNYTIPYTVIFIVLYDMICLI